MIKFIFIFALWFLSSFLFPFNSNFFQNLSKPFFTPPGIVFSIIWPILYFLISISITKIYKEYSIKEIPSYNRSLGLNYFFNQFYSFVFFTLNSVFLGFCFSLGTFISSF